MDIKLKVEGFSCFLNDCKAKPMYDKEDYGLSGREEKIEYSPRNISMALRTEKFIIRKKDAPEVGSVLSVLFEEISNLTGKITESTMEFGVQEYDDYVVVLKKL